MALRPEEAGKLTDIELLLADEIELDVDRKLTTVVGAGESSTACHRVRVGGASPRVRYEVGRRYVAAGWTATWEEGREGPCGQYVVHWLLLVAAPQGKLVEFPTRRPGA
jgi:hypothetical protein